MLNAKPTKRNRNSICNPKENKYNEGVVQAILFDYLTTEILVENHIAAYACIMRNA